MSRDYGKIKTKFWTWAARKKLSQNARILAMYLLSGPHSSAIGIYYLPDGYVCADLGMDPETVCHTLSELSRNGFAYRCLDTDYVFIPGYIEHNPPENMNVGKMMQKSIDQLPGDFTYWFEFIDVLKPYAKRFENGFIKGLVNGMATPEPEPEPEPEPDSPPTPQTGGGDKDLDWIRTDGTRWFVSRGLTETQIEGHVTDWLKDYPVKQVRDAIGTASVSAPANPVRYVAGILRNGPRSNLQKFPNDRARGKAEKDRADREAYQAELDALREPDEEKTDAG